MAKKTCKGCEESFPASSFPNSATAKDGKLGYCTDCWSKRMSRARKKRVKLEASGEVEKPKRRSPRNGHGLDVLNGALEAANGTKEVWEVIAEDGDRKEFKGKLAKRRAIKQALLWKLEGYDCTLREIHEYKPSLSLELIG